MSNSPEITTIPLVHEGDSFLLEVATVTERAVRLHRIIRFYQNQNSDGSLESYWSLDPYTREAIVRQIGRRFPGRTVKI